MLHHASQNQHQECSYTSFWSARTRLLQSQSTIVFCTIHPGGWGGGIPKSFPRDPTAQLIIIVKKYCKILGSYGQLMGRSWRPKLDLVLISCFGRSTVVGFTQGSVEGSEGGEEAGGSTATGKDFQTWVAACGKGLELPWRGTEGRAVLSHPGWRGYQWRKPKMKGRFRKSIWCRWERSPEKRRSCMWRWGSSNWDYLSTSVVSGT